MNSTTKAIMYVKLKAGADGGLDKTRAPHIHQADSGYIVLCVGSRVWQGSDRAGQVTIVAVSHVSRVTWRHVSLERVAVR